MKIVLAFDSFKGCMSASDACQAAVSGIHSALPYAEITTIPLSDGGEGLVNCVRKMLPTRHISLQVHGPLMEMREASYALSPDGRTAYMEMAAASGLTLVPEEQRNPLKTTTYGVGEMMADAIRRGCSTIIMGIGGSATCDAGKGMLKALDDLSPKRKCKIIVACDVTNPLYGAEGAAYVYGPQKGASPEQVEILDRRLREFALETERTGIATPELAAFPGTGAAGGLGYALLAYLKAELHSGIDIVLNLAEFDRILQNADLVITGEGRSDRQTLMGKVPHGVLKRARKAGVPVWLISGSIADDDGSLKRIFNRIDSINRHDHRPLSVLMRRDVAQKNLETTIMDCLLKTNLRGLPVIRQTTVEDIPRLLEIFAIARQFMAGSGNPNQWNADYPSAELLRQDIASGDSYVVLKDCQNGDDAAFMTGETMPDDARDGGKSIVATFVLRGGDDPTYNFIYGGAWPNDAPYATIHRIASSGKQKGILHLAMQFALHSYRNIRIDTHRDNVVMRNAIEKEGFKYCGVIHCWSGDERLAYQFSARTEQQT